jgi:hypothetical protein
MASQFDLAPRLAALQAAGLKVASEYRGTPAIWLTSALDGVDLCVVNVRGIKLDDTIVMVRLATLEKLVEDATHYRESAAALQLNYTQRATTGNAVSP